MTREVPFCPMVGVKRSICLNIILVHCWKRHLRHFPVNFSSSKFLLFCFLLFLGHCWIQYCLYNFIPFFSFMLYSLLKVKRIYMFGNFHFPDVMWHVMTIVTYHRYLFLSLGKIYLHSTIGICYIWPPLSY